MSSEMAKRVDVARFLQVESSEVDEWIARDGMPVVNLPGTTKPKVRLFLPDVHEWLLELARISPRFRDYREFRRAFMEFRQGRLGKEVAQ